MHVYLGIDTGTSVIKGHAIDQTGRTVAHASRDRQIPPDGRPEHDPENVWWKEWKAVCQELLRQLPSGSSVRCVAPTAMVPNLCLLDTQGNAVHSALLFYDDRAYEIEKQLDRELATPRWQNEVLSKLIWLRTHLTEAWRPGLRLVSTHNYITYRLTGSYTQDTVTAAECGSIYDPVAGRWSKEIISRYGLTDLAMPEVVPPLSVVGNVTERAAAETDLPSGVPVIAGTADSIASLIGAGTRTAGDVLIYYGTFNCAAGLRADTADILAGSYKPYPVEWLTSVPRAGHQLRDIAKALFRDISEQNIFQAFDSAAAKAPPGANGLVFLQDVDLLTTTVSSSPRGALLNFQIGHSADDIARAVLESFAYALALTLPSAPFDLPERLFAGGGGARSKVWRQIVSDVLERPQVHVRHSDRAHGSALLALAAMDPDSFEMALDLMVDGAEIVYPSRDTGRYAAALSHYDEALGRLREVRSWESS
ncbi:FGGY family carbohydrate kinase [Pseudofrankia sp. BMG5.37]|uniref:FGGY family carbohydrate kinase n=1 Tax=Pseudofrankia sp. BMG5.37 TaxID=3050035 RepID=UPI00289507D4|nr:FGGY family carbohydrate kinase [Pseudofrankia sp. BMG5.37]MDT3444016.1 FGGY family carbohydrate kinase [Pseudofrankia sp. BMG5.37]